MPRAHRRVRRQRQLGVADLLRGQVAGHLVGERPHVLGVADQVDDRQVDLDEVREVGEGEVLGELVRVGGHRGRSGVPRGQLGDDPRRGRADVVHVQLGLGQAGDEASELAHRRVRGEVRPAAEFDRTPAAGRRVRRSGPSSTRRR